MVWRNSSVIVVFASAVTYGVGLLFGVALQLTNITAAE